MIPEIEINPLFEDAEGRLLLAQYASEMPERIKLLQQAVDTRDLAWLRRLAHQIKGSAGLYGFPYLAAQAAGLEKLLDDNAHETIVNASALAVIESCGQPQAFLDRHAGKMPQAKPRVLIVDDDPGMRRLLTNLLEREYLVREARSGEEALEIAASWQPEIVFLDLVMVGIDGHETCRRIKAPSHQIPPQVVVVSASSLADDLRLAFEAGADDYLVKPVRTSELLARSRLQLTLRGALAAEAPTAASSSNGNRPGSSALHATTATPQDTIALALKTLAESCDIEADAHLDRLRGYSLRIAHEAKTLPQHAAAIDQAFLDDFDRACPLHDLGKIGIPGRILSKPGRLRAHEFDVMKQHTLIGSQILDRFAKRAPAATFLPMAVDIARFHHERWDGSGYPAGMAGGQIPLAARIVAVADVYDALTSDRHYKPAWRPERAFSYIIEHSGSHFDPDLVACFTTCFHDIQAIYERHKPMKAAEAALDRTPQLAMIAVSK